MFDGCSHGARGGRRYLSVPQVRINLVQLLHLPNSAPTHVAIAGVPQVEVSQLIELSRPIGRGSTFIGDCLVVHESAAARGPNGQFIEGHRVAVAAFDASNLRPDQRGAAFEVLRALLRPVLELSVMSGQRCEM